MEHVKLSLNSYESLKADSRELGQLKHVESQAQADLMQAILDMSMVFGTMFRDPSRDQQGVPVTGDGIVALDMYNKHAGSKFEVKVTGTKLLVSRKKRQE